MKKKTISLLLAVLTALCLVPFTAEKTYAETDSLRITSPGSEIRRGTQAVLEAQWEGGEHGDICWYISGNASEKTQILHDDWSGSYILNVDVDEASLSLLLRAETTSASGGTVYDELVITVLPANYVTELKMSGAADATFINKSMTAGEAVSKFRSSLQMDVPVYNQGLWFMQTALMRVPEGHSGKITDWSVLERCDSDEQIEEGREYYFLQYVERNQYYYLNEDDFKASYNEVPVAYKINPTPVVFASLYVYVKADMAYGDELRVVPVGADRGDFEISEGVITVSGSRNYKVGYLSDGAFTAVRATDNGDGTFSFAAPEGSEEVILVLTGDATGEGKLSNADAVKIKSLIKGTALLNAVQSFAADTNFDGKVSNADAVKIKSVLKQTGSFAW